MPSVFQYLKELAQGISQPVAIPYDIITLGTLSPCGAKNPPEFSLYNWIDKRRLAPIKKISISNAHFFFIEK
jgi:hypothetical protein